MIPTFVLLALTVVSLWLSGAVSETSSPSRSIWLVLWTASLTAALFSGVVQPVGLLGIGAFMGAAYAFSRAQSRPHLLVLSAVAIMLLAVGLMLHRVPGFNNPRVISAVRFSADAVPFTLHLNYDKTLIGVFLLGWCHARITNTREWRAMIVTAFPWAILTIVVLLVLSMAAGYIRVDPKVPAESGLWLAVNLLFTCVAEEALFRGFIQAQLQRLWANVPAGKALALVMAAVLFGAAHVAGGAMYVALATVAGLGYGWIYQRTGGRIEASILTHFALNAVHFFAFTYPALQQGR